MKRILPANSVLIAIAINFGFASIPILTSASRDRTEDAALTNRGPNAAIGAPVRLYTTVTSSAPLIAVANDNRVHAGEAVDGAFMIRLEATEAAWYPEGRTARAVPVYVFRTRNDAPQIPGPLIRVSAGTRIRAVVHNALPEVLTVRGLHDRKSALDTLVLAPGETRTIRFRANTAGRYYYWGRTETSTARGGASDSQLAGAFIVDPAGANRDTAERVMVLTRWDDSLRVIPGRPLTETYAMNGYMWPHTERLDSVASDAVVWRVINASRSRYPVRVFADSVLRRWRAIGTR